jgi:hypothetical protein
LGQAKGGTYMQQLKFKGKLCALLIDLDKKHFKLLARETNIEPKFT